MADYFHEMGWQPLGEGETPNQLLHFARLLSEFISPDELMQLNPELLFQELPPPASKQVVEELPIVKVQNDGEQCAVCLKDLANCDNVKQLPCRHKFHSECILPWLGKTNSCPVCRHELPTDDETYEQYRKQKLRAKQREQDIEDLHNSMFS